MNTIASFYSQKTFSDRLHFPYGFARSGQLSKKQADLIERHGEAYKNLASGHQQPATAEEQEFVRCCNQLKEAETEHEKVWLFYLLSIIGISAIIYAVPGYIGVWAWRMKHVLFKK